MRRIPSLLLAIIALSPVFSARALAAPKLNFTSEEVIVHVLQSDRYKDRVKTAAATLVGLEIKKDNGSSWTVTLHFTQQQLGLNQLSQTMHANTTATTHIEGAPGSTPQEALTRLSNPDVGPIVFPMAAPKLPDRP